MVSAAGAVVWEADIATRRVNLARGVREQLGEGPAVETTVDARRLTARVHPDDLPLLLDAYTRAAAGEPAEVSYRVRVADRGFRWLQDNVGPLRASDGTVVGVRGVAVDVTPQRAAAEAELAVARRFAALLEHSSDVVTVIDLQARITYMSPSSERVVGWRAGELTGQPALSLIHPDDVPLVAGRLLEIASKQGEHLSEEYRFRHADGSWRWVESVAHNLLDDPLVGGIVVNTRDVQERHELEARLEHQAGHDPLTGLVNRALFEDRLEHALARASRTARPLGLLFADLDDFKLVNDRYGHAVGDEVLRLVSLRLERGVRAGDTVARYGGDEFVVLCEDLTSPGEADELADRLRCAVGRPVPTGAGPVTLEVSVGVAMLDHDHAGRPGCRGCCTRDRGGPGDVRREGAPPAGPAPPRGRSAPAVTMMTPATPPACVGGPLGTGGGFRGSVVERTRQEQGHGAVHGTHAFRQLGSGGAAAEAAGPPLVLILTVASVRSRRDVILDTQRRARQPVLVAAVVAAVGGDAPGSVVVVATVGWGSCSTWPAWM